jgi:hypothetical protein
MNGHQVVRRLRAFHEGRPLPSGETLHFRVAADRDLLLVAFVRMGGESSPWAIGYMKPGGAPTVLSVPEPRNRDLVADMVARFAPVLLGHLQHPEHSREAVTGPDHTRPIRQIWLPNPTHLEMFHYLAYAYTFARTGAPERVRLLNAFGRATNWVFQESQRPGQMTAMIATAALRESFTFPAEDVRQGHLGFLLAWLRTAGGRDARLEAAVEAERHSVATALDPALERDELDRLVERRSEAERANNTRARDGLTPRIHAVLEPEIVRRLRLVEQAIQVLRRDRRRLNAGVTQLEAASRSEHWYRCVRIERRLNDAGDGPPIATSPETDRHPAAAASRFFIYEESEDLRYAVLVHDDVEVQADAVADGEAFRGTIVNVQDATFGTARATPIWTIESDDTGPLRLREGSPVCPAGVRGRKGVIQAVDALPSGKRQFQVEIRGWKRARLQEGIPSATDVSLRGRAIVMVAAGAEGLSRAKSRRVWERGVPGAWLTHAVPRGRQSELPPEVADRVEDVGAALGVTS